MGIFKQMKDMKDMVTAAPGLVEQAQQMGAQAQQMPAAQAGPDFEPIDGVTLEQFAAVGKAVAAYNYDGTKLPEIAASKGIPGPAWESASRGWNDRLLANPAVAQRYNQLYRAS